MRAVTLVAAQPLSPSVRLLRFAFADGVEMPFVPGQWVNLWVDTPSGRHKRAYSIAGLGPDADRVTFEIAVTLVEGGPVSTALHSAALGSECHADGPHGLFTREAVRAAPTVFVGTGTGVCPLRTMLQDALRGPERPPLVLLFGCRRRQDMLFGDEFTEMAERHGSFSYQVTLSRPDDGWQGRSGYVQTHLADVVGDIMGGSGQRPHVFVCGLAKMVSSVRSELKSQLGFDRKLIHSERYD